tara:strand:+ start:1926 stop:2795 length:870 start_codon:yes stop_codon:yes gene_type:complete
MLIPIDFVAGTHGHFLEVVLNNFFNNTTTNLDPFNSLGASHKVNPEYVNSRMFVARHWFEDSVNQLSQFGCAISIQFDQDDLLLVSSVSLLRAGDLGIDNNQFDIDTFSKLNNKYYQSLLAEILNAYPEIDNTNRSIPRNILREFFKFGFSNPNINGYWKKQQQMHYTIPVFIFKFKAFYNYNLFVDTLKELQDFLGIPFKFNHELEILHKKFLTLIPYAGHQQQCDNIILAIQEGQQQIIPALAMFQESYINGQLENIYKKEMPFHNLNYFTSTKDVLQYLETQAPNL